MPNTYGVKMKKTLITTILAFALMATLVACGEKVKEGYEKFEFKTDVVSGSFLLPKNLEKVEVEAVELEQGTVYAVSFFNPNDELFELSFTVNEADNFEDGEAYMAAYREVIKTLWGDEIIEDAKGTLDSGETFYSIAAYNETYNIKYNSITTFVEKDGKLYAVVYAYTNTMVGYDATIVEVISALLSLKIS